MNLLNNISNSTQNDNRASMVASIVDLKSERGRELEPLNRDLQRKTTMVENAQHALIIAQANQHTATSKVMQTKASYSSQIVHIERKLLASVPDSINGLIEQIKAEERELSQRTPLAHVTGVNQKAKARSEARNERIKTTNARLELLRDCISKCDGLRLQSLEGIATGLETIRESLDLSPVTQ